jgi:hypothetical protein
VTDANNATAEAEQTIVVSEPQNEIVVFADSFEDGLGQWVQDAQNDWFTRNRRATDGSFSVEVDGRATDASISRDIDMQGRGAATITFSWRIERNFDNGEYLAFDVSRDGGASWQQEAILRGNQDPENTQVFETIDVTGVTTLMIRFRANVSQAKEDANLDNVIVTAR